MALILGGVQKNNSELLYTKVSVQMHLSSWLSVNLNMAIAAGLERRMGSRCMVEYLADSDRKFIRITH